MKKSLQRKYSKGYIFLFLFMFVFALSATPARSESVSISWDPVVYSGLQGYNVLYGTAPGSYTATLDAGNNTSYTLSGLIAGTTYYIVAQAYGGGGLVSSFSNELVYTVPGIAPAADLEPPTITIAYPTSSDQYATTNSTISLQGSAADNIAVTQVTWTNSSGGGGSATGAENWQINGLVLTEGTNTITVTASDAAQNTASDVLNITYTVPQPDPVEPDPPVDPTPPDPDPPIEPTPTDPAPPADNYGFLLWAEGPFGDSVPDAQEDGLTTIDFPFEGASGNLVLYYDYFDIDFFREVEVRLNGQRLAYVPRSGGGSWGAAPAVLFLSDSIVNDNGTNTLTFNNRYSDMWGVRNIIVDSAYPLPSQFVHGYGFSADKESPVQATFYFNGASGNVELNFSAYDVDFDDEVEILINGKSAGFALTTANGAWGAQDTVILTDSEVNNSGFNVVTFVNRSVPAGYETWGVKDVSITVVAPPSSRRRWWR